MYTYTNTLRQKVRATETYTEHIPYLGWTTLPQGAKVQHRPAQLKPNKTHQGDTPKHHTSDVHSTKSFKETNHTESSRGTVNKSHTKYTDHASPTEKPTHYL